MFQQTYRRQRCVHYILLILNHLRSFSENNLHNLFTQIQKETWKKSIQIVTSSSISWIRDGNMKPVAKNMRIIFFAFAPHNIYWIIWGWEWLESEKWDEKEAEMKTLKFNSRSAWKCCASLHAPDSERIATHINNYFDNFWSF